MLMDVHRDAGRRSELPASGGNHRAEVVARRRARASGVRGGVLAAGRWEGRSYVVDHLVPLLLVIGIPRVPEDARRREEALCLGCQPARQRAALGERAAVHNGALQCQERFR